MSLTPLASAAGRYVGFQFPCRLAARGRLVGVHSGGICNVRYSNFRSSPPITRIIVNSSKHLDYSTDWSPDRRRVEISVMKAGQPVSKSARQRVSRSASQQVSAPETIKPLPAPTVAPAAPDPVGDAPAAAIRPGSGCTSAAPLRSATEATRPRFTPEEMAARVVAYKLIAEKSRRPAAAKAKTPVAVAANPGASEITSPEPKVRVMGMVETVPKTAENASPVEPAKATWEQAGQQTVAVEVTPGMSNSPRVALAVPVRPKSDDTRKVSLNFLGADINDVLKAISVQSGHNIAAGKDVKGEVTLSLSNVSVDEAMDYVAKLSGYTYTYDNGTYLVAQKDSLKSMNSSKAASREMEFMWVQYSNANDVVNLLSARIPQLDVQLFARKGQTSEKKTTTVESKTLLEKSLSTSESPATADMLVLSGEAELIAEAKQIIAQIEESCRVQKEVQTIATRKWMDDKTRKIYRVNYANPREMINTITALVPAVAVGYAPSNDFELVTFKSAKGSEDEPAQVDREFINSTPSTSAQGDQGSKQGQQGSSKQGQQGNTQQGQQGNSEEKPRDVLTRETNSRNLLIVGEDKSVEKALELAAQLDVKAPQIKIDAKITSINATGEKKLGLIWDWDKIAFGEVTGGAWKRGLTDFGATLEAIITDGNGQLLASPSMICLDRNPGVFFVGDKVTYIQRIETTATGQNITTDTKRVGVQLLVVGETNADGYITLYLHPEVSTLKLSSQQGITLPVVSSRFTDHVVRVKDGQTIVIGGLIRNDEIEEMSKVPFLGDLPLFGHLFRHKHKTKDHTEVVMFITATILPD